MVQTRCFLGTRRLWTVFRCVGFGFFFAWILFGSYGQRKTTSNHLEEADRLGGRKLFETGSEGSEECATINHLESNQSICQFITETGACSNDDGLLDYFSFVYCVMPPGLLPLSMIILFFWLIFLFIFLGATAEEYFCPALTVISQILHLSQNVAGVTLLAIGNGAPDIFSAFAAINQPDPKRASLAFGALLGAGMFVTTVVVGGVTVSTPFILTRRPFMRDLIFYLSAVYWTFFILWDNYVSIVTSVGFILLYVFYVIVVVFGRIIYQKWKKRKLGSGDIPKPPVRPKGQELSSSPSVRPATLLLPGISKNMFPEERTPLLGQQTGSVIRDDSSSSTISPSPPPSSGPNIIVTTASPKHLSQNSVSVKTVAVSLSPVSQEDKDDHSHSRPMTPEMICASQATYAVYGVASDEEEDPPLESSVQERQRERRSISPPIPVHHHLEVVQQSERTRSRSMGNSGSTRATSPSFVGSPHGMRKTISSALNITEDVGLAVAGGATPNLSKIWHHSYRKELAHQSTGHPSSPLLRSVSPIPPHTAPNYTSGPDVDAHTALLQSDEDSRELHRLRHPLVKFLLALWPFGPAFKALRIWGKIYEIVKIPASLILTLTVPVIDYDEEDSNWNRWLNILHCVTGPLFICFTTGVGVTLIGGAFPVEGVVLILGIAAAITVAFTSTNNKPPFYHCLFAWVGFAVAMMWIYTIANEIVNLLQVFGIVMHLSDGILGITLLAWGNSVGDAVANITMARQGFPRMAIGACFGGPLLNMLLGIGLASTIHSISQPNRGFELYFTQVQMFAALFLMFSLASSLVATSLLGFRMKRIFGIYLFCLYIVFLVVVILAEVPVFNIMIKGVLGPVQD